MNKTIKITKDKNYSLVKIVTEITKFIINKQLFDIESNDFVFKDKYLAKENLDIIIAINISKPVYDEQSF